MTERSRNYSNGKLLLTGEYVVLDGATSLALPTQYGQDLVVAPIQENQLVWESYAVDGTCWFEAVFELPKLRLVAAAFPSKKEGSIEFIAETLQNILQEARILNPDFLNTDNGRLVKTHLTFHKEWGLGSSSTLINNIANWANVDAYQLLWNAFSGSGYDIACAQSDTPIFYQLKNKNPIVTASGFDPGFKDRLFFVYLNKKQDSRQGIARYKENARNIKKEVERISEISVQIVKAESLTDFDKLIEEHERIISSIIKLPPVQEAVFPDYTGTIKSLGAWGGDFVLVTGDNNTSNYFNERGYHTVIPYSKMIL